jgi:hypothetical protein
MGYEHWSEHDSRRIKQDLIAARQASEGRDKNLYRRALVRIEMLEIELEELKGQKQWQS